jgi:catechol 2,3-dioxygenase-like lactoylglutathione lyase family enzyme
VHGGQGDVQWLDFTPGLRPGLEWLGPTTESVCEPRSGVSQTELTDSQSPSISGRVEVNLTVRDPASSAAWYSELLGLEELYDFTGEDNRLRYIALVEPKSHFVLCLVGHLEHSGERISEFRTGLDHLEFLVDRKDDLDEWVETLNRLHIPHSGVKQPEHTPNAMLTFAIRTTFNLSSSGGLQCPSEHQPPVQPGHSRCG